MTQYLMYGVANTNFLLSIMNANSVSFTLHYFDGNNMALMSSHESVQKNILSPAAQLVKHEYSLFYVQCNHSQGTAAVVTYLNKVGRLVPRYFPTCPYHLIKVWCIFEVPKKKSLCLNKVTRRATPALF